jgi:ribose transport system substrate-binding protein
VLQGEVGGIQQAARGLGMVYNTCDGKLMPAQWSACIMQAVNAGAAGIITDSIDPSTVAPAIAYAQSHKIPIVLGNEFKPETPLLQGMSIGGDREDQPPIVDWIVSHSGGKADILTSTVQGDAATESEHAGALAELKKNCPDCVVSNINSTPETLTSITSSASAALLHYPNITYGFPEYDFLEPLFARGVQESGHKIKIVSTNDVLSDMQEIKAGTGQVADCGANRNYLGWAATDRLVRMILHQPPPVRVTVPVRCFDSTNIGTVPLTLAASLSGVWWGPITYQPQFLKLWGVG